MNRPSVMIELDQESDELQKEYVKGIPGAQRFKGLLLQGYFVSRFFLQKLENFNIRLDDVLICSYPKSGTTWTEEIVSLIYNGGDYAKIKLQLHRRVIHLEVGRPFFQYIYLKSLRSPRLLATHLPFDMIPRQIREGHKGKMIYVCRNPKDNAVSYFHHHQIAKFLGCYKGSWEEFFNLYIKGGLVYGSWFDHVQGYWEHEKQDNILFLKYEDMKKDLRGSVVKICNFLEKPLDDAAIDNIVYHCSFNQMKHNKRVNREDREAKLAFDYKGSKCKFMRKGIVGDWKNYFSQTQIDAFDKLYTERMSNSTLAFEFDGAEDEAREDDQPEGNSTSSASLHWTQDGASCSARTGKLSTRSLQDVQLTTTTTTTTTTDHQPHGSR